jgi:ERCC4-type nuclease
MLRMTEAKLKNFLQAFSTPKAIFNTSIKELLAVKGIDNEIASAIRNYTRSKETEEKCKRADQLGIKIISYHDVNYPKN